MKNIWIIFAILITFTIYAYFGFGNDRVAGTDTLRKEASIIEIIQ